MTTKDFVVFIFMGIGAILLLLAGLDVPNYKDFQFLPLGLFSWCLSEIIHIFWRPS